MNDRTERAFDEAVATGDWSGFVTAKVTNFDLAAFEAGRRKWFNEQADEAMRERMWNEQVARVRNGAAWCGTVPKPPKGWMPWERNR